MKVLSITNFNIGYAATLPERSLFKGLLSKGVELTVIVPNPNPESKELELSGIKVIYIPITRKIDIKVIRKLRALIKEEKFDILHLTFSKAITNCLFAAWGYKTRMIAYIGSTSVYWHDPFAYLSFLNPRLDRIICLSNGVEEHMIKQAPFRLKGKTIRIYKGYEPVWIKDIKPISRKTLNIPEEAILVCCVANVRKIKGIHYLIKSADFLPLNLPIYFLLVGSGMDSARIKNRISRSKYCNNFRLNGYTSDVLSYTAACDIYVQPSLTEGLGRSVIEAMCLGKPVIVSGTGGVGELIKEGINGYHLPAKSSKALAEKVLLCYQNRDNLPAMGSMGKERIRTEFSSGRMIEETYQFFRSMVSLQ